MKVTSTTYALGAAAVAVVAATLACSPEFAPYNELNGMRVLAVRADKPHLPPEQSATLDLLVHPDPDSDAPVTYRWSWCPFAGSSSSGYECAVERDELQAIVDDVAGGAFQIPPYDLGEGESAELPYPAPPVFLQGACQQFLMQEVPDFLDLPDCRTGFPVLVRVAVTQGDTTIEAVKEVRLLYEDAEDRNTNPELEGAEIYPSSAGPSAAVSLGQGGGAVASRGVAHTLRVEFDPEVAQTFTPPPTDEEPEPEPAVESLAITWFIEGGETDSRRTGLIDGLSTYEMARVNTWTPPDAEDYPPDEMSIYMVVRDNRGGVGWLQRSVELE